MGGNAGGAKGGLGAKGGRPLGSSTTLSQNSLGPVGGAQTEPISGAKSEKSTTPLASPPPNTVGGGKSITRGV